MPFTSPTVHGLGARAYEDSSMFSDSISSSLVWHQRVTARLSHSPLPFEDSWQWQKYKIHSDTSTHHVASTRIKARQDMRHVTACDCHDRSFSRLITSGRTWTPSRHHNVKDEKRKLRLKIGKVWTCSDLVPRERRPDVSRKSAETDKGGEYWRIFFNMSKQKEKRNVSEQRNYTNNGDVWGESKHDREGKVFTKRVMEKKMRWDKRAQATNRDCGKMLPIKPMKTTCTTFDTFDACCLGCQVEVAAPWASGKVNLAI